jgi:Zn ribbon nucleic-acid-binding protein
VERVAEIVGVRTQNMAMMDEPETPWSVATRTVMPSCPECRDANQIEPLLQVEGVWHVRCLRCGYGFKIAATLPTSFQERRRTEERRAVARSGQRSTDLRHPVICAHCGGQNVHGWIRTGETLWARCRTCGRAQRVDDEG